MAQERKYAKTKDRLKELDEISKKYHMPELNKKNYQQNDSQLFGSFIQANQNAYLTFKKSSDVNRMLTKNKFKDARKPQN